MKKKILLICTIIFALASLILNVLVIGAYDPHLHPDKSVLWYIDPVIILCLVILLFAYKWMSKKPEVIHVKGSLEEMEHLKDEICRLVAWNDTVKQNDKDRPTKGNIGAFRAMIRDLEDITILKDYHKMVTDPLYSRYVKFIPTGHMQWTHIWNNSEVPAYHWNQYVIDHNLVIDFHGRRQP